MNTQAKVRRLAFAAASPRLLVAAIALSLGVISASVLATPGGSEGHRHGHHAGMHQNHRAHGMHDMRGMHGGIHHMRGMSRLHDELKLDARQEALWQDAVKAGRESKAGTRERLRKEREETLAMLGQPGADLRAVARRMDDIKAEAQEQRSTARENWFVVYDALNAEQKETARVFFKNRLERMGEAQQARRVQRAPKAG